MTTHPEGIQIASQLLRVSHWPFRAIGVVGIVLFGWFLFLMLYTRQILPALGFAALVVLSIACILMYGATVFGDEKVTHTRPLGVQQIRWDEVREVQFDLTGYGFVFQGDGKRLVLPGKSIWMGKDKQAINHLIAAKQQAYQFTMRQTPLAAYKLSKNVKIPKQ